MSKKKQARQPATLEEIRRLMEKAERRTTWNWLFSIGLGLVALGSGLFASGISLRTEEPSWSQGFKYGGISAVVMGFMIMVGIVLFEKCCKNGK
jgi:hypothetical protein